ncbi:Calbindin-32 [Diplonema papillatum]|nr:Calbindin-32 [Diplonema papillatum]
MSNPNKNPVSSQLKRNIIACQPFKENVATIICSGCHSLMAFPAGSSRVRCRACSTITTGIKVSCTACKHPLKLSIKLSDAQCPSCGYHFQPVSTFRLALPPGKDIKMVEAEQVEAPVKKDVYITVRLTPTGSLDSEFSGCNVKIVADRPLQSNFKKWATKLELHHVTSFVCHSPTGTVFDAKMTPKELGISHESEISLSKEIEDSVSGTHEFVSHQFLKPTNCAYCHKFVWGLYKQGQWCSRCHLPVHHRCAKKVTIICDAALRDAVGLSMDDFDDVEDADVADDVDPRAVANIPDGFPIDEQDLNDWEDCLAPTATYRNDTFLSSFGKLSDWTDEEIAEVWKKYDTDGNGSVDRSELAQFIADLTGAEGGSYTEPKLQEEVERVLQRMDTNNNGIIEWEEFYFFHQAQQAGDFLHKFEGVKLTKEKAKEMWDHYDEDGSGALDTDEVRNLLRDCASTGGANISDLVTEPMGFWELGKAVSWDQFCDVFLPMITECTFAEPDTP